MEIDICELLNSMRLEVSPSKSASGAVTMPPPIDVSDVLMSEDPSYHSDEGSDHSSLSSHSNNDESYGCAYLQAIREQLDKFATTNGEYLEAIFTHREILSSYPAAHHQCARGFSDIAFLLERRAWRADREADTEAVMAFRHEAWSIAASL
ncbi:hypothetical protein BDZ94DRAFT_1151242 [Collybia nuda]|uniref:Uncharacterized protein n=1 Tax=Collybia nuda TaxID=64659 RepID=A0A9P6CRI1_9AGAR|nr:hypothetical protein BDZ94DRAFT_1151242 [Collybia nuda]